VGLASDLMDAEFRGIAFEEAGRTFLSLVPQSVLGFFHEIEYWKAWWNRKNGGPFEPYDPMEIITFIALPTNVKLLTC